MTRLYAATRRSVIGAALAAAAWPQRPALGSDGVPDAATVIVPGPEDGPLAGFALRAARGLARGLVQAAALRVSVQGGPDGITAANRFAASNAPDGRLLLALPGAAAQALLVGDTRARFEPRQWPAIAGCMMPALLAGRFPLGDRRPVRLALPGPGAPEAAALLALDLLGVPAMPVFVSGGVAPETAVQSGAADAAVLLGPARPAALSALGLTPWFTFDDPTTPRDPAAAEIAGLGEIITDPPRPDLVAAVRAAGMALRARALLVLPALTSADSVALWRGAARRWLEDQVTPATDTLRPIGPTEATATLATLCPPPAVALAYREWLFRRLAWQAT